MKRRPAEFAAGSFGADAAIGTERVVGVNLAPALRSFLHRPRLRRREFKPPRDGLADFTERRFAVLDEIKRARRRFLQREHIELGNVVDVYIRPAVDAPANDMHHAVLARLVDQERDLHAAWVEAGAAAVD